MKKMTIFENICREADNNLGQFGCPNSDNADAAALAQVIVDSLSWAMDHGTAECIHNDPFCTTVKFPVEKKLVDELDKDCLILKESFQKDYHRCIDIVDKKSISDSGKTDPREITRNRFYGYTYWIDFYVGISTKNLQNRLSYIILRKQNDKFQLELTWIDYWHREF